MPEKKTPMQQYLETQRLVEKATRNNPSIKEIFSNQHLVKEAKKVTELMNKAQVTMEEFEVLLSDLNYPPIPNMYGHHMNLLIKEIKQKENTQDAIDLLDDYIIRRFDAEQINFKLKKIWKHYRWLNNRIHILEQIVEAHKQGLYFLSVLAVFPQIEGILAETFPEKRNDRGEFKGFHLKESLQEILDVENNSYDSQWDKFYRSNLLKGFKDSEPIEHLSRHALAHGADLEYGTLVNSTKSFIILDYILTKIDGYLKNTGQIPLNTSTDSSE